MNWIANCAAILYGAFVEKNNEEQQKPADDKKLHSKHWYTHTACWKAITVSTSKWTLMKRHHERRTQM